MRSPDRLDGNADGVQRRVTGAAASSSWAASRLASAMTLGGTVSLASRLPAPEAIRDWAGKAAVGIAGEAAPVTLATAGLGVAGDGLSGGDDAVAMSHACKFGTLRGAGATGGFARCRRQVLEDARSETGSEFRSEARAEPQAAAMMRRKPADRWPLRRRASARP